MMKMKEDGIELELYHKLNLLSGVHSQHNVNIS